MQALNIAVSDRLCQRWRAWLAPERQPFFFTAAEGAALDFPTIPRAGVEFTPEARDTNTLWAVSHTADRVAWLSADELRELDSRRLQTILKIQAAHGRGNIPRRRDFRDLIPGLPAARFLWRPEHLTPAVLERVVSADGQACQRRQVPERVWNDARDVLPRALDLAGTFPNGSAGNCFGAVMAAAGVSGAEDEWVQREPFEEFLKTRTYKGGSDDQPGTLLVWRSPDSLAQHTAVSLGGGWAFQKAAQTWWTPRVVLPVRALISGNRTRGWRLGRYSLR